MTCDACGKELVIGEWPFCPHGFPLHGLRALGDEIDETHENLGHEPIRFTSRSEKKRWLKEHNIAEFVRHIGTQGSDRSPHTSRWI